MMLADGLIPRSPACSSLVSTAFSLNLVSKSGKFSPLDPLVSGQSIIPVSETPSSLSSSQFVFHLLVRYLKLVRVDCHVPNIVANSTDIGAASAAGSGCKLNVIACRSSHKSTCVDLS